MEKLYPKVVQGGVIIYDDYFHWDGQRRATDDYFRPVRILNERFYGNEPLVRYHKQPIKMSHGGMPSRSFIMSGGLKQSANLLHL